MLRAARPSQTSDRRVSRLWSCKPSTPRRSTAALRRDSSCAEGARSAFPEASRAAGTCSSSGVPARERPSWRESSGEQPGLIDLGEASPVKAAIPELAQLSEEDAAARLRLILARDPAPRPRRASARCRADTGDVLRARGRAPGAPRGSSRSHAPRRPRRRLLAARARLAEGLPARARRGRPAARRPRALLGRAGAARRVRSRRARRRARPGPGAVT